MTPEEYGTAFQSGFRRTVGFLCSRGASRDTAEDVAQAAWVRGWERLHQLRDDSTILRWVNAIAMNVHRCTIQYEARYETLPELWGHRGIDSAPIDAAKVLKCCRPGDRMLFEQQMGGLTNQELAGKHGVSVTAIRVRLLRARRAARANVEGRARELRESLRIGNGAAVSKQ
jgi:DNA-directed RNA polymerase specialized sigma24 family protein